MHTQAIIIGKVKTTKPEKFPALSMGTNQPDCCATCDIESISGDIEDLIGSPIVQAEVVSNHDKVKDTSREIYESFTWSFYKFSTSKGSVTVRWLGQSNGYYSERVTYSETIKGKTSYVYPWQQEDKE